MAAAWPLKRRSCSGPAPAAGIPARTGRSGTSGPAAARAGGL